MIVSIKVYPNAKDEKDCVEGTHSYQAFALSFEQAETDLGSLERIVEADEREEKQAHDDFYDDQKARRDENKL